MKYSASAFICLWTLAQILFGSAPARGQEQKPEAEPEQTLVLTVFAAAVRPKAPVYLNAALTNLTDTPIYELRQTISFRRQHLQFVDARLGIGALLSGATLTMDLEDASGAKVEGKDAAASVQAIVTATQPLGTGPLVEFEFRELENKEQSIRLRQVAEVRDGEGKPVPGLAFSDLDVTISTDLGPQLLKVFGCFFYMH